MNWNMLVLELLVLVLIVCLFFINFVMCFNYSFLFIDNKCFSSLFIWYCWGIIMKIYILVIIENENFFLNFDLGWWDLMLNVVFWGGNFIL